MGSLVEQHREREAAAAALPEDATPEQVEAEVAARREKSERALDHIAELWLEMSRTEAWQLLADELVKQATRHRQVILNQAFDDGLSIEQRDVDYDRGFWDGLHRASEIIAVARKRLEKKENPSEPETTEEEAKFW